MSYLAESGMVISRDEAIDQIVRLLQPASLPLAKLRQAVREDLQFKEEFDCATASEDLFSSKPPPMMRANLRQGDQFLRAAQNFLASLDNLGANYRRRIDASLQQNELDDHQRLKKLVEASMQAVEQEKLQYEPKRSGGSAEARSDKIRQQVCAGFALSLLRSYHTRKISCGYKPYLEITAIVAEHFEALPYTDMRRACAEMYDHLCTREQDSL